MVGDPSCSSGGGDLDVGGCICEWFSVAMGGWRAGKLEEHLIGGEEQGGRAGPGVKVVSGAAVVLRGAGP